MLVNIRDFQIAAQIIPDSCVYWLISNFFNEEKRTALLAYFGVVHSAVMAFLCLKVARSGNIRREKHIGRQRDVLEI